MTIIDVTLLIALGGFVLAGLWFGIIHMIGSVVGLVLGAFLAGRFYGQVADLLIPFVGGNENLAKIIAFIALFVLVTRLVGLAFHVVEKIFKFIAVLPFLKTFNRLLGAALGLLEGTLVIGLVVYFAGKFPISSVFAALLADSQVARALNSVGKLLAPLLPAAVRIMRSIF
ncbi:MAG: CvpA family protein [Patescibacteria group bacterium]|nr:CvpA family protein [Patescibacteria group bacterium]